VFAIGMSFYIWRKTFIKVDELGRNIQSKVLWGITRKAVLR